MIKKKINKAVFFLVIMIFLAIQIYPVLWLFLASVKTTVELSATPFAFPRTATMANYLKIFADGKLGGYLLNSVRVTAVSLVLIIFLSATAGFAIAKFRFKLANKIYAFFTFGIMIPVQITLIPLFIFYSKMNILNTSFFLVLPQVGFALPLSVMLFVGFYTFIPNELVESAIVDGCSPYRIFGSIIFPLAKNTIITVASMYSIFIWNDFIFANTFISDQKAKTIALGLKDYVGAFGNVDWGSTYAAIAVSILPPMIVYFILNRWVTAGMTMGAVKG